MSTTRVLSHSTAKGAQIIWMILDAWSSRLMDDYGRLVIKASGRLWTVGQKRVKNVNLMILVLNLSHAFNSKMNE